MEDRHKETLLHRIRSRKTLDSFFFFLIANASTAIFIHELKYYDLSKWLTATSVFSFVCLSLLFPVLRFRVWACPRCDHSILTSTPKPSLYNWFPKKCAKCDLDFEETLGVKPRIDVKGVIRLHFSFLGILFLSLYGAMLYGLVEKSEFYSFYSYILSILALALGILSLWALKTRCYHCFLPFQTKSLCSRCGLDPKEKST